MVTNYLEIPILALVTFLGKPIEPLGTLFDYLSGACGSIQHLSLATGKARVTHAI